MGPEPSALFPLPLAILLLGTYSGLLTAFRLWTIPADPKRSNRLLATIAAAMTIVAIAAGLGFAEVAGIDLVEIRPLGSFTLFYSPLVYLYVLSSIRKDFALNARALAHLLPPALLFLGIVLYSLTYGLPEPPGVRGGPPGTFPLLVAATLLIYVTGYLLVAARSLFRHRRFVRDNSSYTDQLHSQWLTLLFSVFLLPILYVVANLISTRLYHQPLYPAIGASIMLMALHWVVVFVPKVFAGYPESLQMNEEEAAPPEKYQSSSLDDDLKARIHQQLLTHMTQSQAFRRDDLTLRDLATELAVNPKYLSQVINESIGKHFFDFVNEYRVRMAQEYLLSSRYQHYTITAIAQEVGFRSRSAFYTAFKKVTGQTPSAFREQHAG